MKYLPNDALVKGSVINELINEINRNKIVGVHGLEFRQSSGGIVLGTRDYKVPDHREVIDDTNNYELPPSMILRSWFGVITAYYNFSGSDEDYEFCRGRYEYEVTLTNTFAAHKWWHQLAGGDLSQDMTEAVMSEEWATHQQGRIFVKAYNVIESLRPVKSKVVDTSVLPPTESEVTSGLHGNGVDSSDEGSLPSGMRVQPVPLGTVIILHEMKIGMDNEHPITERPYVPTPRYPNKNMTFYQKGYYFQYENGIDGTC